MTPAARARNDDTWETRAGNDDTSGASAWLMNRASFSKIATETAPVWGAVSWTGPISSFDSVGVDVKEKGPEELSGVPKWE